jgi:MinD-like ATPase involved in chromosome partitioning or flagellar assembly
MLSVVKKNRKKRNKKKSAWLKCDDYGLMIHRDSGALQQLLRDTQWGELDYLIIDLPPGTGNIQLTMVQKIPVTGAVLTRAIREQVDQGIPPVVSDPEGPYAKCFLEIARKIVEHCLLLEHENSRTFPYIEV